MKVGDLIRLRDSARRHGELAGMLGLLVRFDKHSNPVLYIAGKEKSFHMSQVAEVLNESR
tara:strand:- start:502 stop:681 length:180 start_codon:yes stop_codon:yes gene_type:complete